MAPHPRNAIYYWKCDRPAAFHGTNERPRDSAQMLAQLGSALTRSFPQQAIRIRATPSQGNHLTFIADIDGIERFVRIEDGPEGDDYIEVESHLIGLVRTRGIPAPLVLACDASRREVPFAWQVMQRIGCADLNQHFKQGSLDLPVIAHDIGGAVAAWQGIKPAGFGPFDPATLRATNELKGFHTTYADYFHQHLDRHLRFLVANSFLAEDQASEIASAIEEHGSLLNLSRGCLVHKDLALWNILGTAREIEAFIDFDDAVSGDAMDDLSLLGCFYDGPVLASAMTGYASVRPLPAEYHRRFWLHLLRNMIVKAVIRVGAGYFDRTDNFFLINSGKDGSDLKTFTLARLTRALVGLRDDHDPASL